VGRERYILGIVLCGIKQSSIEAPWKPARISPRYKTLKGKKEVKNG